MSDIFDVLTSSLIERSLYFKLYYFNYAEIPNIIIRIIHTQSSLFKHTELYWHISYFTQSVICVCKSRFLCLLFRQLIKNVLIGHIKQHKTSVLYVNVSQPTNIN
jgi:hypothetical protein